MGPGLEYLERLFSFFSTKEMDTAQSVPDGWSWYVCMRFFRPKDLVLFCKRLEGDWRINLLTRQSGAG